VKTSTMGRAANSVRGFPQRIYNAAMLESLPKIGPETRRVRAVPPEKDKSYGTIRKPEYPRKNPNCALHKQLEGQCNRVKKQAASYSRFRYLLQMVEQHLWTLPGCAPAPPLPEELQLETQRQVHDCPPVQLGKFIPSNLVYILLIH
jgi:hypothetical protein